MSASSKVTLTAALKDELSAPLSKVEQKVESTAKKVEESNKRQGESAKSAAEVHEKAMQRATGATSVLEKAVSRAEGKQSDALHKFEQSSKSVEIAEKRLAEVRDRTEAGSASRLTAEKSLSDARHRQEKSLIAVQEATEGLAGAQAELLEQNEKLANQSVGKAVADPAKRNEALGTLAPAVAVAGGAMTAGFGKVLSTYANFDQAMSQVKAFTQESSSNMGLLREAAIQAGGDTAYSAEEAAQAINELAKAGVSTQDVLGGGLTGAMSLAAAGELEVAKAAEIAAATLVQFKLKGDQIPHLADLLAAGAGKAQGSVEDLGTALNQSGLVAAATGLNIEETTGTLAAFASNGLLGSDAGTSFKTMLQRLTPTSKEAKAEMERLGISAYDAEGKFIGMANFAGVLKDGMTELNDEQRMTSMGIIFGSDAVRAANVLYEQGAEGIAEWTDKVNDAGYAAKTAADLQDNLAGDLEKLGGSIDTVFLKSGSGMNEVLREMVQGLEDVVDWLGSLDPKVLSTLGVLGGFAGVGLLAAGAFMLIVPKVKETLDALQSFNQHGGKTPGIISGIAKAAGKLATIAMVGQLVGGLFSDKQVNSAEEFRAAILGVSKAGEQAKSADLDGLFQKWELSAGAEGDAESVNSLSKSISTLTDPSVSVRIKNWANPLTSFLGGTPDEITQVEGKFKDLGGAMNELVSNGGGKQAADTFRLLTTEFETNGKSAQDALNYLPGYKDALLAQANAAKVTVTESELLNWAMTGLEPASMTAAKAANAAEAGMDNAGKAAAGMSLGVEEATEYLSEFGITLDGVVSDMQKYLDFLFATGLAVMSSRDAQFQYEQSLRGVGETVKDLIKENGSLKGVLDQTGTDFNMLTEAGKTANDAFQGLAQGGMDRVKAMAGEGLGQDELQKKLSGTYKDLISAAGQFDITGTAAEDLARKVMGVPEGVNIDSWMSDAAKKMAEETAGLVEKLDGETAHVWVTTHKNSIYSEQHVSNGVGGGGGQTMNAGGGVYESLRAAAGGAVVPGYLPGVDSELMRVSPGEALLVPELVQELGPSTIMTLNSVYSGGRPAGGGPARAAFSTVLDRLGGGSALRGASGGAVLTLPSVPDTVPDEWVRTHGSKSAPSGMQPAAASSSSGGGITLAPGSVQVRVDGSSMSAAEVQAIVEAAVTAALQKASQEKEQAY